MADTDSRSGTTYANQAIVDFVDDIYHHESEAMQLALDLLVKERLPRIQISAGDGALLALLLASIGARKVVEIGTLTGYSALWLLRGLAADGRLWSLEASAAAAAAARQVMATAGETERVEIVAGAAQKTLPGLSAHGPFDAVFIDADKEAYPEYAEWALDNLRSGGLILADNAFLFGQLAGVAATTLTRTREIEAMQRFHRIVAERCAHATVIPTPDGLAVGRAP